MPGSNQAAERFSVIWHEVFALLGAPNTAELHIGGDHTHQLRHFQLAACVGTAGGLFSESLPITFLFSFFLFFYTEVNKITKYFDY